MCCMKLKSLEVARGKKSIDVQIVLRLYLESGLSCVCCLSAPDATSFSAGMSPPCGLRDEAFRDAVLPPEVCRRLAVRFYASILLYYRNSSCCFELVSLVSRGAPSSMWENAPTFLLLLPLASYDDPMLVLFIHLQIFNWVGCCLLEHIRSSSALRVSCVQLASACWVPALLL